GIGKIGLNRPIVRHSLHEISNRVNKSVFITEDVPRRPPMFNVRVRWFGYQDVTKTLPILRIPQTEKFQPVQLFQIEVQRSGAAIHFEGDAVLTPRRKTGSLAPQPFAAVPNVLWNPAKR
ncbi:MAG: hypothetical protein ACXVP2_11825, partial [Tumebacillaceae bacterium]